MKDYSSASTVEIGAHRRLFSLDEAVQLVALVCSITERHRIQLAPVQDRLNKVLSNDPRRKFLERDYQEVVQSWRAKIDMLGALSRDLWVVEFEVGKEGFLSWRYPETGLHYFRKRAESFSTRVTLSEFIDEQDPDWRR